MMNWLKLCSGLALSAILSLSGGAAHAKDRESQGPFDGNWFVTGMKCDGERPNAATRSLYASPNSISVRINGSQGAFVDTINGCQKTIPLSFSYPSSNLVVANFSGPISCFPSQCDSGCGLDLPLSVSYQAWYRNNTLIWESIGDVDDNCTRGGQSNPIEYTMHRRGR